MKRNSYLVQWWWCCLGCWHHWCTWAWVWLQSSFRLPAHVHPRRQLVRTPAFRCLPSTWEIRLELHVPGFGLVLEVTGIWENWPMVTRAPSASLCLTFLSQSNFKSSKFKIRVSENAKYSYFTKKNPFVYYLRGSITHGAINRREIFHLLCYSPYDQSSQDWARNFVQVSHGMPVSQMPV